VRNREESIRRSYHLRNDIAIGGNLEMRREWRCEGLEAEFGEGSIENVWGVRRRRSGVWCRLLRQLKKRTGHFTKGGVRFWL
jgi:hypothetical protein